MTLRLYLFAACAMLAAAPQVRATSLLMIPTDPTAFDANGFEPPDIHIGKGKRAPLKIATASARSESVVPEVATWALMSIGFGLAGSVVRTRPARRTGSEAGAL